MIDFAAKRTEFKALAANEIYPGQMPALNFVNAILGKRPNGSPGDSASVSCGTASTCTDLIRIAPVGAAGRSAEGLPPLGTFLGLDPHEH